MSDPNSQLPAIAHASGGALITATSPQRIATRMAENLLGVARSQERALAAQKRYRIGDYEFREADHAQIQRWALMLGMEPEQVVEGLASNRTNQIQLFDDYFLIVRDGAIVSLVWDFALLPLTDWGWEQGLQITRLEILNAPKGSLPALPECLRELICSNNQITGITLTDVPQLKKLYCRHNLLTELDLRPVSKLEWLNCSSNQLTALDLKPVSGLQTLDCNDNRLTALDLTSMVGLQELDCAGNQLTKLDLGPVPKLEWLHCSSNQLTALDLSPVSGLQTLHCSHNQLNVLDLTPVSGLQELGCEVNLLTDLDLTLVPKLEFLSCSSNRLTALDLTRVPSLKMLDCDESLNITRAPKI